MALMPKTDPFGIADSNIVVSDTAENASISSAEARGEDGFVVAVEGFGERKNPTVNYIVVGDTSSKEIVLGEAVAISGETENKMIPVSVSVSTSAGSAPTISVTGQSVPSAAVLSNGCKCTVALDSLSALHHAQLLGGVTFTGTGAHLTDATWSAECEISNAEVDGVVKAFDITGGKETVTATIQVSGSSYGAPTVTLPTGWAYTSPLSLTNPNGDFPTYTFTAEHPLAADAQSAP